MSRDSLERAMRRLHSAELSNTTIEVYEPTESYTPGEGYSITYPDTPTTTYDARVDTPTDAPDSDRSGTTAEIDAVARVRDDTGQQWTSFGESGEAPVRITDTADGTTYEVQGVTDRHDGLTTLDVAEV